ncbi:MAG TPA: helix-turn-helix domain-containing protein [Acidothermaceae bacterium]|jgi:AcrR family transcriptional regulator
MRERARQVDDTRNRIVAATVRLHETVGPAATTVAGIAAEAGVTRLTVYRHFPEEESLFYACSQHWRARQAPPDPNVWAETGELSARLRVGFADVYRFYRAGQSMLTMIYRDLELLPAPLRQSILAREDAWCDALVAGSRSRRLRAAVGHGLAFSTWQSLCVRQALSDREAVGLMCDFVLVAGRPRRRPT